MQVRRGITTLNNLLFIEDGPAATLPKPPTIGRDPDLITKRDDLLLHRVYFKTRIQRKYYDDALQELEDELFLSKTRIAKIITEKKESLLLLKKQQITTDHLRVKFPFIVWL